MRIARYLSYAILATLLVAVAGSAVLWQQGYRAFAVRTGSMVPTYDPGSLVVVAPERRTPAVGDVITFRTDSGLVTHRVHGLVPTGVTTKGDANDSPDAWTIHPAQVVGRVTLGMQRAGYLVVFLQQPTGAPALALVAMSTVLAWSLFFPAGSPARRAGAHRRRG